LRRGGGRLTGDSLVTAMYSLIHSFQWDLETIKKVPIPCLWILADEAVKMEKKIDRQSKRGRVK